MWHGDKWLGLGLMVSLTALLSACGGGGGSDTPATGTSSSANSSAPAMAAAQAYGVTQTNQQIASLIYGDHLRTPAGFYSETVPVFDGYVATTQLKTQDINPGAVLRYELCSDDYNQALDWSNLANSVSGDNAAIVTTDITDLYFEFDRLRMGTPNGYLRQRVYRCSYVSRNTVDLTADSGEAGIVNARPMDAAMLKHLSEYLWQFTPYNNFGNVVLASQGSTANHALVHTLLIAKLTHGTGNACDTISLLAWQHSMDLNTGDLTLSVNILDSFSAQQIGGNVLLCAG